MDSMSTFDSTKRSLLEILGDIRSAKIQLPDFQRGWIWDDEHITSLLASISMSYPIGAVMLLQTGNTEVRFKARPVEGVNLQGSVLPEWLILDGQQRLTSLYQALFQGYPVATRDTKGNDVERLYYMDIESALSPNGDRADAVRSLPKDRKVITFGKKLAEDYSTPELEFEHAMFPLAKVFDSDEWRMGYEEHCGYDRDQLKTYNSFNKEVIARFQQYQVPLILLRKETPKVAVCQVFEKVNTGGVPLNVFELLTATFAADEFNLRDDWATRDKAIRKHRVLRTLESTDFLQVIALQTTRARRLNAIQSGRAENDAPGIGCKRKEILDLSLSDYRRWADATSEALEKTTRFLHSQKIFDAANLPYRTQLVPLTAVLATLGKKADADGVRSKLSRWYWSGVFGELYGGAIESRFARDLPQVLNWIDGGPEPETVGEANFVQNRLLSLRTRNSAAYKGLSALLLRDGGLDFLSGDPVDIQMYFDEDIDIHHIFPRKWCDDHDIEPSVYNSVINRTPLSATTNRIIGGRAPSEYLPRLEKRGSISIARMNQILASHLIASDCLRRDDFSAHFAAREQKLLERIEQAMGKAVVRAASTAD